jgi:hypothetical protein
VLSSMQGVRARKGSPTGGIIYETRRLATPPKG